jgi:hypothetical protein
MEIISHQKAFYIEIERASDRFNELALYASDNVKYPKMEFECSLLIPQRQLQ